MRIKFMIAIALLFVTLTGCGYTTVEPGHVGIQVNLSGSDKGVKDLPLRTGRIFYNPITETIFSYPTYMQTVSWTKNVNEGNPVDESITFTTKDSMVVNADVSLSYKLDPAKVPMFYQTFRNDDLATFTHGYLHNVTRDQFNEVAGKYAIEQIMGDNEQFLKEVRTRVQNETSNIGVEISQFGLIGAPRPPQQVGESINAKIKATQIAMKIENEVRQANAEAAKQVAIAEGSAKAAIAIANGLAEANRIKASSITPALLEWERLAAQRESIGRWNGQLPSTVMGGNTPMILSVPAQKQ